MSAGARYEPAGDVSIRSSLFSALLTCVMGKSLYWGSSALPFGKIRQGKEKLLFCQCCPLTQGASRNYLYLHTDVHEVLVLLSPL